MKTVPVVFVAVMALAASVRSQVTDGVDSREPTPIPVAASNRARFLGDLVDGAPPPPEPAKPPFVVPAKDVISTSTVQQGGRSVTIQKIKPIPLPPPKPAPAPEPLVQAAALEQVADISEPSPPWDFLMVEATVFRFKDSPPRTMVTYWPSGRGESVSMWSSADFRLLNGFSDFIAADGHAYSMMLMLSDVEIDRIADLQASDASAEEGQEMPEFSNGKASFTTTGNAPADEQLLAPIQALHEIYNSEHPRLLLAWQGRERARLQREAELKANPPQSKDVTIRYWLKGGREVPAPPPDPASAPPARPVTGPKPRRPRSRQGSLLRPGVAPRAASEPPLPTGLEHHSRGGLPILLLVCFLHHFFTLPACAVLDRNGNGVSDIWELDTNNQELFTNFNASGDDDGDGWVNGAEAIAGTLHKNPHPPVGRFESVFRIVPAVYETLPDGSEILVTAECFVLTWTGEIGKIYSLQWTDDLTSGYWITLGCLLCDGTPMEGGRPVDVTPSAFFRIAISDYDEDADGLTNWEEHRLGTNPALADSDDDGMPDGWEMANDLDPKISTDANGDADGDSLSNLLEFTLHTDPTLIDTDGDGLEDGEELNTYHTDPALVDTDGDTLSDGDEIDIFETNPLNVDSDGDWMDDAFEAFCLVNYGYLLDPNNPADGLLDADGDTLPNQLEYVFYFEGFDLFVANDPATFPWLLDPDGDGLSTLVEFTGPPRTNPIVNLDTDGDGLPDDWERQNNLDPTKETGVDGANGDPDTDGLNNFQEWLYGTDPHDADSDNDGRNDGQEIIDNTDALKQDQPYVPPTTQNTPIAQFEDVVFRVGDPSGSHSERWRMTVKGTGPDDSRTLGLASPDFGAMAQATFRLRKWNTYEVTLTHVATSPEQLQAAGAADYDWETTVDALPAGLSDIGTPLLGGQNNYFMVKHHWLVDNSTAILTTEKHGNETNLTVGKKAILVPVDIDDNQLASGVDDISCTVAPNIKGYQQDHWIMAPCGGPYYSDNMHFNTPLPSAPELWIASITAAPDPTSIDLDATSPLVNWQGVATETEDETPSYRIGPGHETIVLPVQVKTMKKRNINVAVYRVRRPESRLFPAVNESLLNSELDKVFGWQVDAWVVLKTNDITIAYDTNHDRIMTVGLPEFSGLLAAPEITGADPEFTPDIKVLLIDDVMFLASKPPPQTGLMQIAGITQPGNICVVTVGEASTDNDGEPQLEDVDPAAVRLAVGHEIGHVMVGGGHPDIPGDPAGGGVAPLQGTDTTQRLMHSETPGHRLVKAEWDKAEVWLKAHVDDPNP